MFWQWPLPKAPWTQLHWVIAASWAWAMLVAERVLEVPGSPLRTLALVLGSIAVVVSASFAARRFAGNPLRHLPWLLFAYLAAAQWYRLALRRQYEASPPIRIVGQAVSLWHPVTTTDLVLRYHTLASNRLSVERLRLILLTDLHVTSALPRAYYEHVFDLVTAQDADLILLLGDYVSDPKNVELMAQVFARRWPARVGAFAVLGNHDLWTDPARVRESLGAAGVKLVEGRCQHLPASIGRIAICGTEAPWGPELSSALDRSELNLVLSHTPDNIFRLAERGASLVLSGHTHGGQIRMPGFGPIVIPSRFGRLFDEGHFNVAGSDLFVSAGIGADMPPLRIYCQPEIMVVDITRR
jgi:predicted MPP superfamily phosphohydrolase